MFQGKLYMPYYLFIVYGIRRHILVHLPWYVLYSVHYVYFLTVLGKQQHYRDILTMFSGQFIIDYELLYVYIRYGNSVYAPMPW